MGDGWRLERKYLLGRAEAAILASTLSAVLPPDRHARLLPNDDGPLRPRPAFGYGVRSLYFDDEAHRGLLDKLDGVDDRFRYRIRIYDGRDDAIRLEKKSRKGDRIRKETAWLTRAQTERIVGGDLEGWRVPDPRTRQPQPLCVEVLASARLAMLRPAVIVDYVREPFVYPVGNVRITIDTRLRAVTPPKASLAFVFFAPVLPGFPVLETEDAVLEVKSEGPLPPFLRELLPGAGPLPASFSKYAICRVGSPNGPDVAL